MLTNKEQTVNLPYLRDIQEFHFNNRTTLKIVSFAEEDCELSKKVGRERGDS